MLTEEHIKEDLSRAYIQAISAKAGVIVSINNRSHDYGIDGSFHQVSILNNRRIESGITLDFQLKATSRNIDNDSKYVNFSLDSNVVNLLANRNKRLRVTPAILIILLLPAQPENWLSLSENELVLRKCCYWSTISSPTLNTYSAILEIPKDQIFTPKKLQEMLEEVREMQLI